MRLSAPAAVLMTLMIAITPPESIAYATQSSHFDICVIRSVRCSLRRFEILGFTLCPLAVFKPAAMYGNG